MSIESRKNQLILLGWQFEEQRQGSEWQVAAQRKRRILLARSRVRTQAWEAVLEATERASRQLYLLWAS